MNVRLFGVTASAMGLAALLACAPPPSPTSTPAASGVQPPTAQPSALPTASLSTGPVISAFQIIDDVDCSGPQVLVPVSWVTHDVQRVELEVDHHSAGSGPVGYPPDGVADMPVPCDGHAHTAVLVASGPGGQVSESRQVNTVNGAPPAGAPLITQFDVLDDISCSGTTVDVAAAWFTQNVQAVNLSVDGQPLSEAAAFPLSGIGRIRVPCDGKAHVVTLTATGTGPSASLSRSVNTTTQR